MSVIWLKTVAAALFLIWLIILIEMRKVQPRQLSDSYTQIEQETDIPIEAETLYVPSQDSFNIWKEILSNDEQTCNTIIDNPLWHEMPVAYNEFKQYCDQKNVAIVNSKDDDWISKRRAVYFDDCNVMPLLWKENYNVELVKGKSMLDLLQEASLFSVIILSVKDEGSQALNHKWQEKLCDYGIRSLTREYLRHSYINIIWKKSEFTYTSIYEEWSEESLSKQYSQGQCIDEFKFPMHLEVTSEGQNAGNYSSIKINGVEYSPNMRGMNMVIYDVIDSKVERVHRVDTFVSVYEDTAVYRALPVEGEKHAT